MNRIYRLKRNHSGYLVVVSELENTANKTTQGHLDINEANDSSSGLMALPLSLGLGMSQNANANVNSRRAVHYTGSRVSMSLLAATLAMMGSFGVSANSYALTGNPQVVAGQATISSQGLVTNIKTVTDKTIINWDKFNINKDEIYNFIQNNRQSAVLNRVLGGEVSKILGTLKSNGQVFIINPAGVVIGKNATIDAASLVVSSLDLSNEDFLAGNYKFANAKEAQAASILNQGVLSVGEDGKLMLIGGSVINQGVLKAEKGSVYLLAGKSISIADFNNPSIIYTISAENQALNLGEIFAGKNATLLANRVYNQGSIKAVQVDKNGVVELVGAEGTGSYNVGNHAITSTQANVSTTNVSANTTNNSLVINNSSLSGHQVAVNGDEIAFLSNSSVSAQANNQSAGKVYVGGLTTLLGEQELANSKSQYAQSLVVESGANFLAESTQSEQGQILAYANTALYAGTWSITNGAGIVETSAKNIAFADDMLVNTSSGNWYLDPVDIYLISNSTLTNSKILTQKAFIYQFANSSDSENDVVALYKGSTYIFGINYSGTSYNSITLEKIVSAYQSSGTLSTTYNVTISDNLLNNWLNTTNIVLYTPEGNISASNINLETTNGYSLTLAAKLGNISLDNSTLSLGSSEFKLLAGNNISITSSTITANQTYRALSSLRVADSTLTGQLDVNVSDSALDNYYSAMANYSLAGVNYVNEKLGAVDSTTAETETTSTSQQPVIVSSDTIDPDSNSDERARGTAFVKQITASKAVSFVNSTIDVSGTNASVATTGSLLLKNVEFRGNATSFPDSTDKDNATYVSHLGNSNIYSGTAINNVTFDVTNGTIQQGRVLANGTGLFINTNTASADNAAYLLTANTSFVTANNGYIRVTAEGGTNSTALQYVAAADYLPTGIVSASNQKLSAVTDDLSLNGGNIYFRTSTNSSLDGNAWLLFDLAGATLNVTNGNAYWFYYSGSENDTGLSGYLENLNLNNATLLLQNTNANYLAAGAKSKVPESSLEITGNISATNGSNLIIQNRGSLNFDYYSRSDDSQGTFEFDSSSRFKAYASNIAVANYYSVSFANNTIFGSTYPNSSLTLTFRNITKADFTNTTNNEVINRSSDINLGIENSTIIGLKTNNTLYSNTANIYLRDALIIDSNLSLNYNYAAANTDEAADSLVISANNSNLVNTSLNVSGTNISLQDHGLATITNASLTLTDGSSLIVRTGNLTTDNFTDDGKVNLNSFVLDSVTRGNQSTVEINTQEFTLNESAEAEFHVTSMNVTANNISLKGNLKLNATLSSDYTYENLSSPSSGTLIGEEKTQGIYFRSWNTDVTGNNLVLTGTSVIDLHTTQSLNFTNTTLNFSVIRLFLGDFRPSSGEGSGLANYSSHYVNFTNNLISDFQGIVKVRRDADFSNVILNNAEQKGSLTGYKFNFSNGSNISNLSFFNGNTLTVKDSLFHAGMITGSNLILDNSTANASSMLAVADASATNNSTLQGYNLRVNNFTLNDSSINFSNNGSLIVRDKLALTNDAQITGSQELNTTIDAATLTLDSSSVAVTNIKAPNVSVVSGSVVDATNVQATTQYITSASINRFGNLTVGTYIADTNGTTTVKGTSAEIDTLILSDNTKFYAANQQTQVNVGTLEATANSTAEVYNLNVTGNLTVDNSNLRVNNFNFTGNSSSSQATFNSAALIANYANVAVATFNFTNSQATVNYNATINAASTTDINGNSNIGVGKTLSLTTDTLTVDSQATIAADRIDLQVRQVNTQVTSFSFNNLSLTCVDSLSDCNALSADFLKAHSQDSSVEGDNQEQTGNSTDSSASGGETGSTETPVTDTPTEQPTTDTQTPTQDNKQGESAEDSSKDSSQVTTPDTGSDTSGSSSETKEPVTTPETDSDKQGSNQSNQTTPSLDPASGEITIGEGDSSQGSTGGNSGSGSTGTGGNTDSQASQGNQGNQGTTGSTGSSSTTPSQGNVDNTAEESEKAIPAQAESTVINIIAENTKTNSDTQVLSDEAISASGSSPDPTSSSKTSSNSNSDDKQGTSSDAQADNSSQSSQTGSSEQEGEQSSDSSSSSDEEDNNNGNKGKNSGNKTSANASTKVDSQISRRVALVKERKLTGELNGEKYVAGIKAPTAGLSDTQMNLPGSHHIKDQSGSGNLFPEDPTPSKAALNAAKNAGIASQALPYGNSDSAFKGISKTQISQVFAAVNAKTIDANDNLLNLVRQSQNLTNSSQLKSSDLLDSQTTGQGLDPVRPYGQSVQDYSANLSLVQNFSTKTQVLLEASPDFGLDSQARRRKGQGIQLQNQTQTCLPATTPGALSVCYAPGSVIPAPEPINLSISAPSNNQAQVTGSSANNNNSTTTNTNSTNSTTALTAIALIVQAIKNN
ncbi:filamentous hemagglutinin N-terminal domain-containing protein [Psittacicella hinzii]|nr:filamentous hemagglutinin N-terminal domain-containing protein [Psittacicella hinzii]